jgi:CubicO group peptidase (beta-lactamase class C family)
MMNAKPVLLCAFLLIVATSCGRLESVPARSSLKHGPPVGEQDESVDAQRASQRDSPLSKEAAGPDVKLPNTAAGRQFKAWLEAFNSGNAETIRQYLGANLTDAALKERPLQERVDRDLFVHQDTGGFKVTAIEQSSANEIVVAAKMKSKEKWVRVTIQVKEQAPHGIAALGIRVLQGPPAADSAPGKLSDAQIADELADFLDQQVAADRFSGAILIARHGKAIFQKAFGLANRTDNLPNRLETRFNLGSMNKMFTAIAIMQLVEQGKLALTDPVAKHLPDYTNREVATRVTVDHLLSHTSGMGDYFNALFSRHREPMRRVSDFLPFLINEPLAFAPGTKWQYSNAGYIVLGLIIEKVSGQDYYNYVKAHIYEPAGMSKTGHRFSQQEQGEVAIGYSRRRGRGASAQNGPGDFVPARPESGSPAGGGYSTVLDMLQFDGALRNHKLVSAKITALMTHAKKLDERGFGYAYGFGNHVINGQRLLGHNGGAPGIGAQFDDYPDLGYTVVILSNYDYRDIEPVVDKTRQLIAR